MGAGGVPGLKGDRERARVCVCVWNKESDGVIDLTCDLGSEERQEGARTGGRWRTAALRQTLKLRRKSV